MARKQQQKEYFNFLNSLDSEYTKREYSYCLARFLNYIKLDLSKFLKLPEQKITNLIIKYLVQKKVGRSAKNTIFFTIKHACEVNDVILNWKKIKKFAKSQRTGNEIAGRDRPYTHQEIQQILTFSNQQVKAAFLILASTGTRIGALPSLKVGDLQRIDDIYKVNVYAGEKENYYTFCTPECAKEIDSYLEFRKRRGEKITNDSYLLIKRFSKYLDMAEFKGQRYSSDSLGSLLQETIENSGLRQIDRNNPHKRKEVALLHGLRKFTTKALVDSNVKAEIREMLLGHKIGLTSVYYKPTEQDMLNEYYKAVPLLTISDEERVKFKLAEHIKIEKTRIDNLEESLKKLEQKYKKKE